MTKEEYESLEKFDIPCINTCHMTEADCQYLERLNDWEFVINLRFGFMVNTWGLNKHRMHLSLAFNEIIQAVMENNQFYIIFDRDADVCDFLPIFDW